MNPFLSFLLPLLIQVAQMEAPVAIKFLQENLPGVAQHLGDEAAKWLETEIAKLQQPK